MLVLLRFPGEAVMIGDHVEVMVVSAGRGAVTLEITTRRGVRKATLRAGEPLEIDAGRLHLIHLQNERVSIGFDVPRSLAVYRKEIWEDIQAAREADVCHDRSGREMRLERT